jgi:hypothetical protein
LQWINLFLLGCIYLFLPIVYVQFRNCTKPKKGLILSVTLPIQAHQDEEVLAYCRNFRKRLRIVFWVLTAVLVPFAFVSSVSVTMTASLLWMDIAMAAIFLFYAKSHAGLRKIKNNRGWQTPVPEQPIPQTVPETASKPVKPGLFILPMILSLLPVLSCFMDSYSDVDRSIMTTTALIALSVTALSLVFYGILFRQRPEAMDDDRDLTAALTRVRRRNWSRMWLSASWLTAAYAIAVWLSGGSKGFLLWTVLYTVAMVTAAIITEFSARRGQERLTAGRTPLVDEDDYWIWGQFYCNPHDKRTFVPDRIGMNMSTNLAKPAIKVLYGLTVLLLLALPLLGFWFMGDEFSPIDLSVTETAIEVQHNRREYTIPLEEVTQAQVLEKLPEAWKQSGTNLPNLYKGRFTVEGYGTCNLCLDPNGDSFLLLQAGDDTWIFSGEETQLQQILAQLP